MNEYLEILRTRLERFEKIHAEIRDDLEMLCQARGGRTDDVGALITQRQSLLEQEEERTLRWVDCIASNIEAIEKRIAIAELMDMVEGMSALTANEIRVLWNAIDRLPA